MLALMLLTFLLQLALGSAIVPTLWGLNVLADKMIRREQLILDHTHRASGLAIQGKD